MNKLRSLIAICISVLAIFGCNKADDGKYEILLIEDTISTNAQETILSIPYSLSPSTTTSGVTVSCSEDWLHVLDISLSDLRLVVSANNTGSDRYASVTLSHKGAKDVICHLVQTANGKVGEIIPESKLVYLDAKEGDYELGYSLSGDSGSSLSVKFDSKCDWLSATEITTSKISFRVSKNGDSERATEVTLSCKNAESVKVVFVQNPVTISSTIKISSAVYSVSSSTVSLNIPYSISGESAGKSVMAEINGNPSWISISSVTPSAISLSLEPNTSKDNRSAEINLSLEDAREVSVTVVQKADSPFDITVTNVTSSKATVTFVPQSETVTYAYSVEKKSLFESYGSEKYIQNYVEALKEMAEENGVGLKDLLAKGSKTVSVDNLKDDTEYYALAFDLDENGNSSGKVTLLEFKTPKATPSENKFSFEVSTNGVVKVKTLNNDPYIFDVWDIESWNEFDSPMALAERFVEYMKGFDGAIEMYTHRGDYSENYTEYLTKGKNVAFAFGYKDGITTDVYFYIFDWN